MNNRGSSRKIELGNQTVTYKIRNSHRSKRVRLTIYCDGNFMVSAPRGISVDWIETFMREKTEWILEKLRLISENSERRILLRSSREEYLKMKQDALYLAIRRVCHYNQIYGLTFNQITIRNQKTRWGSCSTKGNLSYNYQILKLPEKYLDYIIVHELCHLKEFNHSKRFWDLVEVAIPNCREIAKEMRELY